MSKKASVLFVTEFYPPHIGGVEILFAAIAEELAGRGHKVGIVTTRVLGAPKHEVLNGVDVHRVWVPPVGSRYFFTFLGIFPVLWFSRGYDIFQTTVYNAALPAALAGLVSRKRVFVVVHEVWDQMWFKLPGLSPLFQKIFHWFEKAILALPFEKYICVSENTRRDLVKLRPGLARKAITIYNGLDYTQPHLKRVESDKNTGKVKTILFFGRPGISKGVEFMLESFNNVTNPNLRLRLVLSNDEPKRYELMKSIATNPQISIGPSLPRAELVKAIAEADYVIVPSISEGFGFVALETCILGKKLICSDQGALPEVVYGDVVFYNPWKKEELTNLLNRFDESVFEHIPVRKFPIEKTVDEYLKLY